MRRNDSDIKRNDSDMWRSDSDMWRNDSDMRRSVSDTRRSDSDMRRNDSDTRRSGCIIFKEPSETKLYQGIRSRNSTKVLLAIINIMRIIQGETII